MDGNTKGRRAGLLIMVIVGVLGVGACSSRSPHIDRQLEGTTTAPEVEPVCMSGTVKCDGQFGRGCYSASAGQTCTNGLVCPPGSLACTGSDSAHCYSPAEATCP
jgi:hypothetical protein